MIPESARYWEGLGSMKKWSSGDSVCPEGVCVRVGLSSPPDSRGQNIANIASFMTAATGACLTSGKK